MSYQELLELTERFLCQQDERFVLLDNETKILAEHTKKAAPAPKKEFPTPQPIVQKAAVQVSVAPAAPKPIAAKPQPAVVQQNLKPQGIPCLPKPFVRPEFATFDDIKSKIKIPLRRELPSDVEASEKERAWMKSAPKIALFSFFPKNSAKSQFIETIVEAIHTRLGACKHYILPDIESLTELYIYAQHSCTVTCFIAYDATTQAKANEFLLPLQLDEEARTNELFNKRGLMYNTTLYDITVSDELAADALQKRELWNKIKLSIA